MCVCVAGWGGGLISGGLLSGGVCVCGGVGWGAYKRRGFYPGVCVCGGVGWGGGLISGGASIRVCVCVWRGGVGGL